jgi:hypothetical protein
VPAPQPDAGAPPVADPAAPPVPGAPRGSAEPPRNPDDELRRGRVTYMPLTTSAWDAEDVIDYHPTESYFDYHDKVDYHPVP